MQHKSGMNGKRRPPILDAPQKHQFCRYARFGPNREQHRAAKFYEGTGGARTIDQFFGEIDHLQQDADERAEQILADLYEYAEMVAPAH